MKKLAAALAGVMVFSMAACGGAEDFDATGYVQGVLDAQYHGEYAAHAEDVGESEEDIKNEIEASNLEVAQQALAQSGFTATDEELQEYIDLIEEGYKKIEYEVKEAVKDDNDNFTVEVEVTPVGLLDNLEEIFTAKLQEAVNNGVDESGYMAVFNESVKESIDKAETLEPQTVTLNVTYTEDEDGNHVYAVNESDLNTLDLIATNQQ
ncbi:MAG: hypothetical protein Q4C52_07905 [Eubacteriales bacterium]|nr:hypothetical protein [Eubacteriales bacterium]